jgi:hypothetical protein
LVPFHGDGNAFGARGNRAQGLGHHLHRPCGSIGVCCTHRELRWRHHWLAGCFLGYDAPRGGDSNLSMAEPAVNGAPNGQPCRKAFLAAEATPYRLRDGWSHAHLRRGICEFHIPATVP